MGARIHPAQLLQPQLPRAASSKLKDSPGSSPGSLQPCWASPIPRLRCRRPLAQAIKKKQGWFDDPFNFDDDEEDDEEEFAQLLSRGEQSARELIPDRDEDSVMGFLDFPAGYMPETASLGAMIRNDVRRCLCIVSGGVYENLLFFPVIQLLKNRYPGVKIDIMAGARGKQVYELNKNVRRAWVHDVDKEFLKPVDFLETIGKIKNEYYDLLVSTKYAGLGHSMLMWLSTVRNKVSYVYPNVNSAGSTKFLDIAIKPPQLELAESGIYMYSELMEELCQLGKNVFKSDVLPLEIAVPKRVKAFVENKYMDAGVQGGGFLVFHGIKSDSSACMTSNGDLDSLLPAKQWSKLAKSTSEPVVFVIPNEKDREKVQEYCGDDSHIVLITTPGQLAALVKSSSGVVTTNTAALQMAIALKKPVVALFSSQEKANIFVPNYATDCVVVASKTGKLIDLDTAAAAMALSTIGKEAALVAV